MSEATDALPKLKEAYRHWSESKGASLDSWRSLLAERVQLSVISDGAKPALQFGPPAATREEAVRFLSGITESFDMLHFAMERFVCEGDTIVAIGSSAWRHKGTGKDVTTPLIDIWCFKDGQAVSCEEFFDTARAAAAAIA